MKKIPAVWSKGIALWCDTHGPDSYPEADTESVQTPAFFAEHFGAASGLVWVRLSTKARGGAACDLEHFVRAALPLIRQPFVLITTDGDVSVPSELPMPIVLSLLSSPFLRAWFTQNHSGYNHPKLFPFPVGLDFHTPRPEGGAEALFELISTLRAERGPIVEEPLRTFCDFGLTQSSRSRREAVKALRDCEHVVMAQQRVSQTEVWRQYASHPFVLSAPGFGLDCHRTYEALYLGSIVIAKRSSLDSLYDGLPVVLIDNWAEARNTESLAAWRRHFAPLTDRAHVTTRLHPQSLLAAPRRILAAQ